MEKMRISPSSWKTSLTRLLRHQGPNSRIAILGIGNTFRSDDAAGSLVARALLDSPPLQGLENLLVIDAAHAPENSTAELRRFAPATILLIDAAEMNEAPGTIRWIDMDELDGMSACTHSLPLSMLARYLTLELNCEIILLGIQPQSNEVGEGVAMPVIQSVGEIADFMIGSLFAREPVG